MRLIGVMPCRNEAWVCGLSTRVALRFCDELVCLNHASTDNTAEILADVQGVHVINEPDPLWAEMSHRQRLLEAARERGATHIAIIDADEVLTANLQPYIRDWVEGLVPGTYLRLGMPCMRGIYEYQTNDIWGRAVVTAAFADSPDLHWKAAEGYDFHHREPYGSKQGAAVHREHGGVMHLQFAHRRRLLAKHALYQMTETLRWPGRRTPAQLAQLYSLAPELYGIHTVFCPGEWWDGYQPLMRYLDLTSEPWQEAEVRRLWAAHGPQVFAGLNLFGLV